MITPVTISEPWLLADTFDQLWNSFLDSTGDEPIETWRLFAMAAGVGPYMVETFRTDERIMLRLVFRQDGSGVVITPDGSEGEAFYGKPLNQRPGRR